MNDEWNVIKGKYSFLFYKYDNEFFDCGWRINKAFFMFSIKTTKGVILFNKLLLSGLYA